MMAYFVLILVGLCVVDSWRRIVTFRNSGVIFYMHFVTCDKKEVPKKSENIKKTKEGGDEIASLFRWLFCCVLMWQENVHFGSLNTLPFVWFVFMYNAVLLCKFAGSFDMHIKKGHDFSLIQKDINKYCWLVMVMNLAYLVYFGVAFWLMWENMGTLVVWY
jgi:hypothetical protein